MQRSRHARQSVDPFGWRTSQVHEYSCNSLATEFSPYLHFVMEEVLVGCNKALSNQVHRWQG